MTDRRPPLLPFELSPERAAEVTPLADEPARDERAASEAARVPPPRGRRRGWVIAGFFAALFGLLVLEAIDRTGELLDTRPLLGWPFLALLLVVAATTTMFVARELRDLARMRKRTEMRDTGARLARSDLHGEAEPLLTRLSDVLDHPAGVARYERARSEAHADNERLVLYERHVLAPLDKRAYRLVLEGSRDIGLLTALSPLGLLDGFLVIWRTLMMNRQIARLYGLTMGPTASLSLLKRCLRNAAIAGVADAVSHATIEHVGAGLTAMLSARAGQGAGNALLAARLGLEAIRLARPLPYIAEEPPRLRHVREAILEKGEIRMPEETAGRT